MTKLRLAGVLTAIALVVGLLASVTMVSAQGVTVITGNVTFNGTAAPAGTAVQVVDADGEVVASTTTGRDGLAAGQYRADVAFGAGSTLPGSTLSLQVLSGDEYVPAQGAVTVVFAGNAVINQDIETNTAAPVAGVGPAGPAGPEGAAGAAGKAGARGPFGAAGADGADGADGTDGADGATGATGARGPQGADGSGGSDGASGANGATGAVGPAGAAGEEGGASLSVVALIISIVAAVAAVAGVISAKKK